MALREGAASAMSGFGLFRRNTTRSTLVVAQVALAVTLLVAGGLVVRSFLRLITTNVGFEPSNVLTFQLRLPKGYTNRQVRALSDQLVQRVASLPGVNGAAYGTLPLVSRLAYTPFQTSPSEQLPPPPAEQRSGGSFYTPQYPELRLVSRDYLRVMGMRVVAGRDFSE
jgi:putative ABC transport system permease protein